MWANEDERDIATAFDLLEERQKALARGKTGTGQRAPGAGGSVQYSG